MTKIQGGYCDKCNHYVVALYDVQTCKQTHSSPAEYERWCRHCIPEDRDEAYERAAARYDGEGKDWR